jgi:co-chaperonin GroES (HSP10)
MVSAVQKMAQIARSKDAKQEILDLVGDLNGVNVTNNQLLVATYIESEKTEGGIYKPQKSVEESRYQGKVGLVLKKGPFAFVDDASVKFHGQNVGEGQWVVFRFADAWETFYRGVSVRFIFDTDVRAIVDDPSQWY